MSGALNGNAAATEIILIDDVLALLPLFFNNNLSLVAKFSLTNKNIFSKGIAWDGVTFFDMKQLVKGHRWSAGSAASISANLTKHHAKLRGLNIWAESVPIRGLPEEVIALANLADVKSNLRFLRETYRYSFHQQPNIDVFSFTRLETLFIRRLHEQIIEQPHSLLTFSHLRKVVISLDWSTGDGALMAILPALAASSSPIEKLKIKHFSPPFVFTTASKDLLHFFESKIPTLRRIAISGVGSEAFDAFRLAQKNCPDVIPIVRVAGLSFWESASRYNCQHNMLFALPTFDSVLEQIHPKPFDRVVPLTHVFKSLFDVVTDAKLVAWIRKHLTDNLAAASQSPAKISQTEILIKRFLTIIGTAALAGNFWSAALADEVSEIFRDWAHRDIYVLIFAILQIDAQNMRSRVRAAAIERICQTDKGLSALHKAMTLQTCLCNDHVSFLLVPHVGCLLRLLRIADFDITTKGTSGRMFSIALLEHNLVRTDEYVPAVEKVLARYVTMYPERIAEFATAICNSPNSIKAVLQSSKHIFNAFAGCFKSAPRPESGEDVWKRFIFHRNVLQVAFSEGVLDLVPKFAITCLRQGSKEAKKLPQEMETELSSKLWNYALNMDEKNFLTNAKSILKLCPIVPEFVYSFTSGTEGSAVIKPLLKRLLTQVSKKGPRK